MTKFWANRTINCWKEHNGHLRADIASGIPTINAVLHQAGWRRYFAQGSVVDEAGHFVPERKWRPALRKALEQGNPKDRT